LFQIDSEAKGFSRIQHKIIYLTNELAYCSESMAKAKRFY
jgi:hypothetical protein